MKKPFIVVYAVLITVLSGNVMSGSLNKYGEPEYRNPVYQEFNEGLIREPVRKPENYLEELTEALNHMPETERDDLLDGFQRKFKAALEINDLETAKRYLDVIEEWR